jgi:hypothetical protein
MVAQALLDAALSSNAQNERSIAIAAAFIQSALADLERIERLDNSLLPVTDGPLDLPTLKLVWGMYEEWAQNTEALLNRIEQLEKSVGKIVMKETLWDAYGKLRAMLSITLEGWASIDEELEEEGIPLEAVRRELRDRVESSRKS